MSENAYVLRQSQSGLTGTVYVDGQQIGAVRRRGPRNWNALRAGHWQASRVPFISADAAAQMVVVWAARDAADA